jgi:hypothetical protein
MNNLKEKIELYEQQILPQQRQRLEELKMKHYALITFRQDQNRVQNIISKWWINYQKNDLEAWILYHEEKLQNWKNQCHDGFD